MASQAIPILPFFTVAFVGFLIFLVFIRIDLGIRNISEHILRKDKLVLDNKGSKAK
jgi:phosphotransferase system  glucose/maltose/N-acetylglucosamine-specific IIC component